MTFDPLAPTHPKRERLAVVAPKPVGYILTLDRHVVATAGKNGIIARLDIAKRLETAFAEARPDLKVEVFGIFPVTS